MSVCATQCYTAAVPVIVVVVVVAAAAAITILLLLLLLPLQLIMMIKFFIQYSVVMHKVSEVNLLN